MSILPFVKRTKRERKRTVWDVCEQPADVKRTKQQCERTVWDVYEQLTGDVQAIVQEMVLSHAPFIEWVRAPVPAAILEEKLRTPHYFDTQIGRLCRSYCERDEEDDDDDAGQCQCTASPDIDAGDTACLAYSAFAYYIRATYADTMLSTFYECPHVMLVGDAETAIGCQRFTPYGKRCFWCANGKVDAPHANPQWSP